MYHPVLLMTIIQKWKWKVYKWELPSDDNTSVQIGKMKKSNKNNKSINRRRKLQVKPNVHGVNVKSKFNPYK